MRADMNGVGVRMVVGVAAVVTVALGCPGEKRAKRADSVRAAVPGITEAKVASDSWSSKNAGSGVNRCLDQKAATAWKLAPGAVKAGRYLVRMTFTGR
jgi:hypothetical protein